MTLTADPATDSEGIVVCSCPGCGELVQHVASRYTPSGEAEFRRLGLAGEDTSRACETCQKRPEDRP